MYRAIRDLTRKPPTHNVTATEKWLSIGGGLMLIGKGLRRPGPLGWVHMAVGAATVYRGMRGYCPAKQKLQEMREKRIALPPPNSTSTSRGKTA
ncbi:YgaP family membrane protein [Halopseudomonas pertucinogena]|uniref:Inner membrane protein YgaP-like transmembrane domain-containing protein n=1 Tax=Halopseudomonas pertucinogena TaxID=86175 RepID=A0ABQ2CM05_9GAMM|nr:YgaP-like transmembrane domain [Halopseudomonas pertucinogena]GGI92208.1 hypothetical protein GCM10009083_05910 [Halopseudomonas pertucinogena]